MNELRRYVWNQYKYKKLLNKHYKIFNKICSNQYINQPDNKMYLLGVHYGEIIIKLCGKRGIVPQLGMKEEINIYGAQFGEPVLKGMHHVLEKIKGTDAQVIDRLKNNGFDLENTIDFDGKGKLEEYANS